MFTSQNHLHIVRVVDDLVSSLPHIPPTARWRRSGDICVWCVFVGDTACGGAPSGLRGMVIPRNCPHLAPYTKTGRKCGYLVHQVTPHILVLRAVARPPVKLDLASPSWVIDRQDSDEMRQKILAIPYAEWKKMGFSKGTLYYLKKNARDEKPFTMNKHVRLEQWDSLAFE